MGIRGTDDSNFAISLRFWANTIHLEDLAATLGLRVDHFHTKGQPKLMRSGLSKHPAQFHYLGIESFKTSDVEAIDAWFDRVLNAIEAAPELKNRLMANEITGSIIMALFPNDQYQDLSITVQNIQRAKELRVAVELEDYLHLVGGNPGYKKIV